MEFITREDFKTHMYDEVIDAISDEDEENLTEAIDAGLAEAFGYIERFDIDAILSSQDKRIYAALRTWIKDIAKWHFIAICNVSTDLALAESRYDKAIKELSKIQLNRTTPRGWPLKADNENEAANWSVSSRPKRGNYF